MTQPTAEAVSLATQFLSPVGKELSGGIVYRVLVPVTVTAPTMTEALAAFRQAKGISDTEIHSITKLLYLA